MNDPTQIPPRWSTTAMRQLATGATLASAAARYADLGVPVFPCVPGAKQPLTPNGFHDATTSAGVVEAWWRRTPKANIGLPTGSPSGVLVVDVDVHQGGSGFAAFERASAAGVSHGWGWLVRTPSGGLHAYYPPVAGMQHRSWQLPGLHVDFRGDGGYVIAPPSRIHVEGHLQTYAVIAVAERQPRPLDGQALREFLQPPTRRPRPAGPVPLEASRPDRLADWVAQRPEGARNQGLFWAACRMVEAGHRYEATASLLGEAAAVAGLSEREAETTIRSAYRAASPHGPRTSQSSLSRSKAVSL